MSTEYVMDDRCFACGQGNINGLHMNIVKTPEGVETTLQIPSWAQSYANTVHGGIIATVLDEMAVWAAYYRGYRCVTAELNVRVRHSMNIDAAYRARARVTTVKHKLVLAVSEIFDSRENIIASACAKLMNVS